MMDINKFDRDFARSERRFDIMFKVAVGIFIAVFALIVAGWVVTGMFMAHEEHQIAQHGLKSVVEQLWCGQGKQCL